MKDSSINQMCTSLSYSNVQQNVSWFISNFFMSSLSCIMFYIIQFFSVLTVCDFFLNDKRSLCIMFIVFIVILILLIANRALLCADLTPVTSKNACNTAAFNILSA